LLLWVFSEEILVNIFLLRRGYIVSKDCYSKGALQEMCPPSVPVKANSE